MEVEESKGHILPKTGSVVGRLATGISTLLAGLGFGFFDRKRK